jgi:hypothetical protein
MNCAIALDSKSTSYLKDYSNPPESHYYAIVYSNANEWLELSQYTTGASLFANVNSADCGDFTACSVKPKGCGSGAYSGNLAIRTALGIKARQNVAMGYDETACIECQNAAGSIT